MEDNIFDINFEHGETLKHIVDFLTACVGTKECSIEVSEKGISMDYKTPPEQNINIGCFIKLRLEKDNFVHFKLTQNVKFTILPKLIQQCIRSKKKKDELNVILTKNGELQFISKQSHAQSTSYDCKNITNVSYEQILNDDNELEEPQHFSEIPYILHTSKLNGFKKEPTMKKSNITLEICGNEYLQFEMIRGQSNHIIRLNNIKTGESYVPQKFNIPGEIMIILMKLLNLVTILKIYHSNYDNLNIIKIKGNVDKPYNLGTVTIIIMQSTKIE